MHTERLRKAHEDPELRESAKFVIDAVRASMTRYIDWLTFTGMALKDYTAMNPPHQPVITVYSPGKDVMERARDTNNGSQLALAILEERLEL